jgi:hypothetical protein
MATLKYVYLVATTTYGFYAGGSQWEVRGTLNICYGTYLRQKIPIVRQLVVLALVLVAFTSCHSVDLVLPHARRPPAGRFAHYSCNLVRVTSCNLVVTFL